MKLYSALHSEHLRHGARFKDYFGWQVPAVYSTEEEELARLRHGVAFTEYGFMNHLAVCGADAVCLLQRTLSVNVCAHAPGRAFYALALDEAGKVLEDVIVYRLRDDAFVLSGRGRFNFRDPEQDCLLAVKQPKRWLAEAVDGRRVCVHNLGVQLISVQGPRSHDVLAPAGDVADLPYLGCKQVHLGGIPALVARNGFSGELGFEILVWPEYAIELWQLVERLGQPHGIVPYGVNLLRIIGLEKGYLGGPDFYPGSTPFELGLEWAVDLDKGEFNGKEALMERMAKGMTTKLVGLELANPAPVAEPGGTISLGGDPVGRVTASGYSATVKKNLARGWVGLDQARAGTQLVVQTPGGAAAASVAETYCWYDRAGARLAIATPPSRT